MWTFSPDFLMNIAVSLITAGALYGGIRADMRSMHEKISTVQRAAARAHERIDSHLDKSQGPQP